MLAAIELQNVELHDAVDRGDQDLAAAQRQRFVRGLKIGIADGVVDDVGALAAGEFAHARGDIDGGSVDHLDLRVGMSLIRLAPARHADGAGAVPGRDLHGGLPDLAVDAHDQHGIARLRHAGAAQAFHRGDEGNADAGRLLPRNRFRLFDHGLALDHQMRGMGAVAADAEIAGGAEHLAADPVRGTIDHDAGIVAAGRAREYGIGHQAGGGLDVGGIDGRGLDLDQQVVFAARQRVPLDHRRDRSGIVGLRQQAHAARLDGRPGIFGDVHHDILNPHARSPRLRRLEGCRPVCGLMVRDGASRLLTRDYPFGRLS